MFLSLMANVSSYDTDKINRQEVYCMATAVYHESRGEDIMGQIAVAHVILNRINSNRYPDTACKVIYQPKQFTDIAHANPDYNSYQWENAIEAAVFALTGIVDDPTAGAMHYYNPHKADPYWAGSKRESALIGNHRFMIASK